MNCKTCNRNFANEQEAYYVYYTEPRTYQCWFCSMEQRYKEYIDTFQVSTKLFVDAYMYNYYVTECDKKSLLKVNPCWLYEMAKYGEILQEIYNGTHRFIEHWRNCIVLNSWLAFNVCKCKNWRSATFKSKDFSAMLYSLAGRTMVTFKDDKCDFTIIGLDDSSYLSKWSCHGIYGKVSDLYCMMDKLHKIFPELQKDDEVFIV